MYWGNNQSVLRKHAAAPICGAAWIARREQREFALALQVDELAVDVARDNHQDVEHLFRVADRSCSGPRLSVIHQ